MSSSLARNKPNFIITPVIEIRRHLGALEQRQTWVQGLLGRLLLLDFFCPLHLLLVWGLDSACLVAAFFRMHLSRDACRSCRLPPP